MNLLQCVTNTRSFQTFQLMKFSRLCLVAKQIQEEMNYRNKCFVGGKKIEVSPGLARSCNSSWIRLLRVCRYVT